MLVLQPKLPERFDLEGVAALAVTSKRVAGLLAGHSQLGELARLPVYAVGDKTAEAMTSTGFGDVRSAGGDVTQLGNLIAAGSPKGRVLYLAARERSGDLDVDLDECGIKCTTEVVYAMRQKDRLDDEALLALEQGAIDAVLIYSRRTGDALVSALMAVGRMDLFQNLRVIAISRQSAAMIPEAACVEIAPHPSEEALLEQALSGC